MSISGSLEDVSVADVMQFIHLGRRTGTLVLARDEKEARIGFHQGKLVSVKSPGTGRIGQRLVEAGLLDPAALEAAVEEQRRDEEPRRSLGQILLGRGLIGEEDLRRVVVQQIEATVGEVVSWSHGTFRFVVDDRAPIDDVALFPGEVLPEGHVNTQMVLLEAARIFDEKNRDAGAVPSDEDPTRPGAPAAGPTSVTLAPDLPQVRAEPREGDLEGLWVDVVSTDLPFADQLAEALAETSAHVARVELREVAASAPAERLPVAVVDLRELNVDVGSLERLRKVDPDLAIIALVGPEASFAEVYGAGALATLPADVDAVVACLENLFESRQAAGQPRRRHDPLSGVERLRRVYGDLRSGVLSATVALNLMHIISESVERAVLFLVKREQMVALGAFGTGADGRPLAEATRGVKVPLDDDNALTRSYEEGEARSFDFGEANLPEGLVRILGRPATGQIVVFPVLGTQRVISVIYADNGPRHEPIEDIEILELATAQVGMAFENELLRRQISSRDS